MDKRDKLYIDGQWVKPSGQGTRDVINAATEEVMGHVPKGDVNDVNTAVAAARRAFEGWAATPAAERAALLKKIQDGLKARTEQIARTITGEVGMPLKFSTMIQTGSPTAIFGMYSKILGTYEFEEKIGTSLVVREPIGVVAAITPWNYPLHQIAAKVAPALAAGCTVVLKPSDVAPLNAFILADIIHEAGLPAGVFNLVAGPGVVVGEAMSSHPEVDMVSFTGSTNAGKRISELAAKTIKRVALELGGKSAAIVLDDADFAVAIKATVNGCFLNSGQTCTAHTRLLVPESRYDEVAKLAVEAANKLTLGDPMADTSKLGPVISDSQRKSVQDYIRKGIADGAELLCGGPDNPPAFAKGYYVQPTIFGRVKSGSTIEQEEIFGPVLSIITYKDEDDAVRIANNSIYGLSGAVWASSDEHATRVARRLRTGQVDINGGPFNFYAPFGGYKQSGNGRELGKFGLEEFLEVKSLQLKPAPQPA